MSEITNIQRKELKEEFDHLGVLIMDYHNKVMGYSRQYNVDRVDYYLEKARKCLVRREEILTILYGHGTGIAI